jgi:hypothetical protein
MNESPWGDFCLLCVVVDKMLLPTGNVAEIGQSTPQKSASRTSDNSTAPVPYGGKPSCRTGLPVSPVLFATFFINGGNADIAHQGLSTFKAAAVITKRYEQPGRQMWDGTRQIIKLGTT